MVEVDFYNGQKRLLGSMFGESEIPDGVSEIKISGQLGVANPTGFQQLLNLLKRSDTRVNTVNIEGIQDVTPDYLAFLVWISSRTHTLELKNCTLGDSGFACLMSGILLPNGLTKLDFDFGEDFPEITRHQATLLFEAIASSSSLETFWIRAGIENLDEMGQVLVHALRRNRSLKDFSFITPPIDNTSILPNLLKAAVLQTKVSKLELGQHGELVNVIPVDVLVDVVCRQDCSVNYLSFDCVLPDPAGIADHTVTERNSSVEELEISYAGLESFEAMKIIRLFNSLKRLKLADNKITDLSPLDSLLVGEKANIEILVLNGNDITEDDFKVFVKKLPMMNSLKSLEIGVNPASNSESCLTALKDAVWLNKSLEKVYYSGNSETPIPNLQHIDSMIRFATSLNRGAKRKMLDEYPLTLPRSLWPHVLKRASTIKYFDNFDAFATPTLTSPRVDVVFWLLRQKMLC